MKHVMIKGAFLFLFVALSASQAFSDEFLDKRLGLELFKEGVSHFNRKEYEAAIDFFRKSLRKIPQDTRVRYFLGMAYYKAGFEENAIFEFNTIIESHQGDLLLENLVEYINLKQFLLRRVKKSDDYSVGLTINGISLGKYILSRITGIDVDGLGNIYVCGFGSKIALKLSPTGEPLLAFTSPKISSGRLYDIAVDNDGNVYVSDFSNDTVYKFTEGGKYLGSIGTSGFGDGQLIGPTSLTLDRQNDLYVLDSGNMRVVKFSAEGDYLLSFGREGEAPWEFRHPSGLAVDRTGKIYVADHGKKIIHIYDSSGNFITSLNGIQLTDPFGISFVEDNRLIISDQNRIYSYDLLHSTWTEIDTGETLKRVLDVKMDRLGQLYACDFEQDIIVQFMPEADKYRNLHVFLNRVDTESFPTIVYYVSVLDADGLPLYGLEPSNFSLKLGEADVSKVDLHNEVKDSRLNLLFMVDKSLSMAEHAEDVKKYLKQFVATLSDQDEMAVIGFNNSSWIASSFTRSSLRTMDSITEDRYAEGKAFDKAFRRSIDFLNKRFYKKALIVITDGILNSESFSTYSFESTVRYAQNNHIPVYILNFGGKENESLDYLARASGGKFYNVLLSNDFSYLKDTIWSYRSAEYIVYFGDTYDPALKGLYMDAKVEVDFNGRIGQSWLGLVYP